MDGATANGAFRIGIYGILREGSRVLLTRSATRAGLIWNFPGGALEYGESVEDCLRREFLEETGMPISIGEVMYVSRRLHFARLYADEQLHYAYFGVSASSGALSQPTGRDVVERAWHDSTSLPLAEMNEPDREFCAWLGASEGKLS